MIARRWHGRVPSARLAEYLRLMAQVRLPDYRSTSGNRGAWCLFRRDNGIAHVEMFTLWTDFGAIRRFAGDDLAKAYGVHGIGPIENPNDLAPALKRAIDVVKRGEPALVDVVTQGR